jgi:hypothetical protein
VIEIRNPTADSKPVINTKSSITSIRRTIGSIFFRLFMLDGVQKWFAHRVLKLLAQIGRGY